MIGLAVLLPWGLAVLMLVAPRSRPIVSMGIPLAALPAAAASLRARGTAVELDWALFGVRLGVDDTAAVFLILGSVVWFVAATYARSYLGHDAARHRFEIFFLATMGAQLGLSMAQDAVGFYLFYWVMTVAAYGLVVHDGSSKAWRAGRIYLVMAILGEGLLLPAVLFGVAESGATDLAALTDALRTSPYGDLAFAFVLLGFAVKVGLPPLHFWLPLAHPAAPIPASAILSGLLIKAGLLGWLRFLPLGSAELPQIGGLLVVLGTAAALAGAAIGTLQSEPKSALAYSSISQMGWMSLVVGLGLQSSSSWVTLSPVLLLFVVNHGLAKSALFLGVDAARVMRAPRAVAVLGLILPALALVGAPLTVGASLKAAVKSAAVAAPGPFAELLPTALSLATFATALVLVRAIHLILAGEAPHGGESISLARYRLASWLLLVALGALLPLVSPLGSVASTSSLPAIAAAGFAAWLATRLQWQLPEVAPGDLLNVWPRATRHIRVPAAGRISLPRWQLGSAPREGFLASAESRLADGRWLAAAYGAIVTTLLLLSWPAM